MDRSGFPCSRTGIVFSIFLSFLLPIWSLSFATEAIGGEQEIGQFGGLFEPAYVAACHLPGQVYCALALALGLNLGGFGLLCLREGGPGQLAFQLYWPRSWPARWPFARSFILWALLSASAVVAVVYSFFLGNCPSATCQDI